MPSRRQLLLLINVSLFVYSLVELIKNLAHHNNFFTPIFQQIIQTLGTFTDQLQMSLISWQNLVYLLIFFLVLFIFWKFWRLTFVLLEIIATLLILDYLILYAQREMGLEKIFEVAVMLISLFNIWQNSRDLKRL